MNTPLYSKIDTKGVETGDRSKGKNPRHMRVLQGMKHMRNASCDTIIKPKTLTPSPFLDREHAYQNVVHIYIYIYIYTYIYIYIYIDSGKETGGVQIDYRGYSGANSIFK